MFLFMFIISMVFLIFSSSYFSLLMAWEGLGLTSFFLVLFYHNWDSMYGANLTLMMNRIGDSFLLMGFFILYESNSFFFFIMLMIMTKSCQFPFLAWLPSAMSAPTPISALVHSSTLVISGIILLIQYQVLIDICFFFFFVSLITILLGSMYAINSFDYKKIVAYSTLSQLGWMVIFMYTSYFSMMLCYTLCHAIIKSMLFLSIGIFITQQCSQAFSGSNSWSINSWSFMSIFSMMSFFGSPLFFFVMIKEFSIQLSYYSMLFFFFMVFLSVLSTIYSYRMFLSFFMTSNYSNKMSYSVCSSYSMMCFMSSFLWISYFLVFMNTQFSKLFMLIPFFFLFMCFLNILMFKTYLCLLSKWALLLESLVCSTKSMVLMAKTSITSWSMFFILCMTCFL